MSQLDWPVVALVERGQGYRDGSEDVRGFKAAFLRGLVTPTRSLLLASAVANARTVSDVAGNVKLAKSAQGGRHSRSRDDAAAAAILAVSLGWRKAPPRERAGIRFEVDDRMSRTSRAEWKRRRRVLDSEGWRCRDRLGASPCRVLLTP